MDHPAKALWDIGVSNVFFPVLASVSVIILTAHLYNHFTSESHVLLRDTKRHNWRNSQVVKVVTNCSICEALLNTRSYFCDSCGVAADTRCLKKADKSFKCKLISRNDQPMVHHWVRGNVYCFCYPLSEFHS